MRFSLVICTFMRAKALNSLLDSVKEQSLYPNEIIIIDGSLDDQTKIMLSKNHYKNLKYFKVDDADRGLTKQRNLGVKKVNPVSQIICFLDDDVILENDYFEQLLCTYTLHHEALAVGGYITNEVDWQTSNNSKDKNKFYYDGWIRNEPTRFKIRRLFGLLPDKPPAVLPSFAHGRSVSFLPPSGKIYEVEQIMGGVSSYRKEVFQQLSFSTYFEGYGLYEDADFSLRIAKLGKIFVNTNARLAHYHEVSGRPNHFKYGIMVVRNGWYVWRIKYPKSNIKAIIKFHATAFILTIIRASNVLTSSERRKALMETLGRVVGWFSLIFNKPKLK